MEKTFELIIKHIPIVAGYALELVYNCTLYPVYCIL
jgi:hypothetical protein